MTEEIPPNRCGYTWPPEHGKTDDADRQSCCYREVTAGRSRCIWHADPEKTGKKPAEELRRTRTPPDVRDLNGSAAELLDGVQMADQELGNTFDFTRAKLRGADFSGADLQGANLSEAGLEGNYRDRTDLSKANLESADLSKSTLSCTDFSNTDRLVSDRKFNLLKV